jgi:NAD(P)-dependent dehydrogenase (short-subunit alcohol dehydrogenase family)
VDILVNNAGCALGLNSVETTPLRDIQTMVQTNVLGLMCMTTTFSVPMRERGSGHIINIGSVSGHHSYAVLTQCGWLQFLYMEPPVLHLPGTPAAPSLLTALYRLSNQVRRWLHLLRHEVRGRRLHPGGARTFQERSENVLRTCRAAVCVLGSRVWLRSLAAPTQTAALPRTPTHPRTRTSSH